MPKKSKAPEPPLVYADADVYLDLIMKNKTPHPDLGEARGFVALGFFQAVDSGQARLAASSLLQAEVACNGEARVGKKRIQELLDEWWHAPQTTWRDVDRYLTREAVRLTNDWHHLHAAANKKMSAADALHLAAAVDLGCDYFFSYDGGFPLGHNVEGVQVMRPDVVWDVSLLDSIAVNG